MNSLADFLSPLHPQRLSSQDAPSTLLGLGTLTHVTKPAGLRGTAVTGVCWRQQGPRHPINCLWQLAQCQQHWCTSGAPGEPWPTPGLPEICPDAGICQLACTEQGFPGPAPAAGKRLQGHPCRGGKGTLLLVVSCTGLAHALCFKSLRCCGSSPAPANPLLPPFSWGSREEWGQKFSLSSQLCLTHGNPFKITV